MTISKTTIMALWVSIVAFTQAFGALYVKLDAQGGTFAVPGITMNAGDIPDEVISERGYSDPVRIGYNFAGWSSFANPKTDDEFNQGFEAYYATPISKAMTFYAIWEKYDPNCYDDNGTWTFENGVISGMVTNNYYGNTLCSYYTPGRGWVSFKWRLVDRNNPDVYFGSYGSLEDSNYTDGREVFQIYSLSYTTSAEWQKGRVPFRYGEESEVFWRFVDYSGDAKLEISQIVWEPAEDFEVNVRFSPCGGMLDSDAAAVVRSGRYGNLPTPEREGCEFLGWTEEQYHNPWDSEIIGWDSWLPLSSNVTIYAVWSVPYEKVLDPFDTITDTERNNLLLFSWPYDFDVVTDWKWENDSSTWLWAGEHLELRGGNSYSSNEIEVFTTYVHGCGVFHIGMYGINIYLDGERQYLHETYNSDYGVDLEINKKTGFNGLELGDDDYDLHEIVVTVSGDYYYQYYGSGYYGHDLYALRWDEAPAELEVLFDPRGGILSDESTNRFQVGQPYGELPLVTREGFEFMGWFLTPNGGEAIAPEELVHVSATNLYARWTTDLTTAIGDGHLRFASKGAYRWVGTSDFCHGDDYAAAGTASVESYETNVMTTVVQGPGTLSFWWLKGGESRDTVFTLWLDGKEVSSCRNISQWRHMTLPVLGNGNHKVEWKYSTLDGSYDWPGDNYFSFDGEIRPGAWVDDIVWTPAGELSDIITWGRGVFEGRAWLTNALPLIEAEYTVKISSEPHNYEWLILRATTKLCRIAENENLKTIVAKFGFAPDYGILGNFFGTLNYYDAPLSNEVIDSVMAEIAPSIESALSDLETIPNTWDGQIALSPDVYPVDVFTYIDLADVTLCKAVLKSALSAIAIAESYDFSIDYMNVEMEAILADAGLKPTFEDMVSDHPDFMKRVRDAQRLGEGKELLRDALTLLKEFDRLMVNRSSSEMHFFEYDDKDSEMQQYARDEVEKMLSSLDGTVAVVESDFRYLRHFDATDLPLSVSLMPFFDGVLTRRFLPSQINHNLPVFDSFPSMSFGGILPSMTKEKVASILSNHGYEVEYTPNSDYDPPMLYRTFNSAIPLLGASATDEEIKDALAGTVDVRVKEHIFDASTYASYAEWAYGLNASGTSLKQIKMSPFAWLSYALATPKLLISDICNDNIMIEEFKPLHTEGDFDFTIGIKGVEVGSSASAENLQQIFYLEGAESLDTSAFSSDKVDVEFTSPKNGKLKFKATQKNDSNTFFMRLKRKR